VQLYTHRFSRYNPLAVIHWFKFMVEHHTKPKLDSISVAGTRSKVEIQDLGFRLPRSDKEFASHVKDILQSRSMSGFSNVECLTSKKNGKSSWAFNVDGHPFCQECFRCLLGTSHGNFYAIKKEVMTGEPRHSKSLASSTSTSVSEHLSTTGCQWLFALRLVVKLRCLLMLSLCVLLLRLY
jgi:hypothetical protein